MTDRLSVRAITTGGYKVNGILFSRDKMKNVEDHELRCEIYINDRHFDYVYMTGRLDIILKKDGVMIIITGNKNIPVYFFSFPSRYYMASDDGDGYAMFIDSRKKRIVRRRKKILAGQLTSDRFSEMTRPTG
jgi:hypothetical protein